jgi:N-acetylmuramic acid 6-phosphate etherase
MISITESESLYHDLEKMTVRELLESINTEDQKVPEIVKKSIPQIEKLVDVIVARMKKGGRLFYIGAGTSGRLGIVDASEIPHFRTRSWLCDWTDCRRRQSHT